MRKTTQILIFLFMNLISVFAIAQTEVAATESVSIFGDQKDIWFATLLGLGIFLLVIILMLANTIKTISSRQDLWQDIFKHTNKGLLILILVGYSCSSYAETPTSSNTASFFNVTDTAIWVLILVDLVLALSAWLLAKVLRRLVNTLHGVHQDQHEADFVEKMMNNLTLATPIEREEEVMMDHEYDGIRELDNVLPPWWVYLFYATIVFAVVYVGYYHFGGGGKSSSEEYAESVAIAEQEKQEYMKKMSNLVDESNVTVLDNKSGLESGKNTFITFCAACHGQAGEGGVGPNLTDNYWLNGGDIKDLFKTIKYGVTTKGMKSWKEDLTPSQIQEVASYITTLHGTNPPNGKEPQGELYKPNPVSADSTAKDTTIINP